MASQASGAGPASSGAADSASASAASGSSATQQSSCGGNTPGSSFSQPSFSHGLLHPSAPGNAQFQQPPSPAASANQLQQPQASPQGPSFSYNISQQGVGFPRNQQFQPNANASAAVVQGATTMSMMPTFSQSVPLHAAHNSQTSTMPPFSAPYMGPTTSWVSSAPSFSMPPRMPAPPGLAASSLIAPNLTVSSSATESSSFVAPRAGVRAPIQSNPDAQQHIYPQYPSIPSVAPLTQGPWLHPPQLGGVPRPPFMPYLSVFPSSYPTPARGLQPPSVPLPNSQPHGVTPMGPASVFHIPSALSGHQIASNSSMQTEVAPPGTENGKHQSKDEAVAREPLDSWTAHKSDTGIVYYYNALTGVSTYERPPGFRGEADKVTAAPTSVSVENLASTDWALVTTNDGKKFYYNNTTKLSSWQMPSEVAELRKQQEVDILKEPSVPVTNTNALAEKGTAVILNAPALNTGGRDAAALRTSSLPGSSSALDLIKKKLQDSGFPVIPSSVPSISGPTPLELNGSRLVETTVKSLHSENSKDKLRGANGDGNMSDSSSDSEGADSGPTKEECIIQFKEMLKERGVAPFSKWEKELPKIVFDPRFKAVPSYSARRSLFERYVKTRAEEERKEKRAAQKAAIENFKQLLDEAVEDIDMNTSYQTFRKKWANDPRFEALDRKDRELLLNERVLPLKRAAEEKVRAERTAAADSFKSMLKEKDVNVNSRWSRVKDGLRNDPRYKFVRHEDREVLFNEYVSQLKAAEDEAEQELKVKRDEQEKLKERERELRKRKERDEHEVERVRLKVRRKEAVSSFQALLVETIKDPQASWAESKLKLEKDPQRRASNPDLDPSDTEKLFREHVKMLYERCANEFRALLVDVLTTEAAAKETEDGKTVLNSWSTAKHLLKPDPRYSKMPRKDREALWRRYTDEVLRKQKSALTQKEDKHADVKHRHSADSGRYSSGSRKTSDRR